MTKINKFVGGGLIALLAGCGNPNDYSETPFNVIKAQDEVFLYNDGSKTLNESAEGIALLFKDQCEVEARAGEVTLGETLSKINDQLSYLFYYGEIPVQNDGNGRFVYGDYSKTLPKLYVGDSEVASKTFFPYCSEDGQITR